MCFLFHQTCSSCDFNIQVSATSHRWRSQMGLINFQMMLPFWVFKNVWEIVIAQRGRSQAVTYVWFTEIDTASCKRLYIWKDNQFQHFDIIPSFSKSIVICSGLHSGLEFHIHLELETLVRHIYWCCAVIVLFRAVFISYHEPNDQMTGVDNR